RARGGRGAPRRRAQVEQGDRLGARHLAPDREHPSLEHLPQARGSLTRRAGRRSAEAGTTGIMSVSTATPARSAAPAPAQAPRDARTVAAAREALAIAFGPTDARGFAVRLWDDSVDAPAGSVSPFTLVVRRPGALRRAPLPPSELALVEAYLRDDLDAEGHLGAGGRPGVLSGSRRS